MRLMFVILLIAVAGWYFYHSNSTDSIALDTAANAHVEWPPRIGSPYPDLLVVDHRGQQHHISDFFGKVLVIEPVGMTCEACNAFSGAATKGGFKGQAFQQDAGEVEKFFPEYTGGISLHDDGIIFIQILLYDLGMNATKPTDAQLWAQHFGLDQYANTFVVVPAGDMRNEASFNLIPGFQLVDKNGILRRDSAGHTPPDDLWRTTLPEVPLLLSENSH